MSCPKCGSGAVFQGKCRECGTVVDPRRASSVGVARTASLGDDDKEGFADATIADPRGRRPDPNATEAPSRRAPEVDDDPERTRMPPAVRTSSRLDDEVDEDNAERTKMEPVRKPARPEPEPARPKKPRPAEPEPREPEPLPPVAVKDRSSWYKAAGLRPPSRSGPKSEDDLLATATHEIGEHGTGSAVLFAQAAASLVGVAFGLSPVSLLVGGIALIAAILLWRGLSVGRLVGWIASAVLVLWSATLAVGFRQSLLGMLTLAATACFIGTMLLGPRGRALSGIGVVVALLGLALPFVNSHKPTEASVEVDDGYFEDAATGLSARMPGSVSVYSRKKDIEAHLPAPWPSVGLRLGFATADAGFVGGLLQTTQKPGAELRNLLAPLSGGSSAPPRSNDRLVPDGLRGLETEGWELPSAAGELVVVLARAPDGRAITLFGAVGTARARNLQLFKAVAAGVQLKKQLGVESD